MFIEFDINDRRMHFLLLWKITHLVLPLTGVTIAFSRHYGCITGVSIRQGV